MIKRFLTLFLLISTSLLVACGQAGALYLPGHEDQVKKSHRVSSTEGRVAKSAYKKISS